MGKIGALTDVVKSGLTKADEFLDYLGNKIGNLNIPEFSPSLKAAENLPQEIGNYKDLKAWMIKKGGAKGGELEWSGADEFFAGKKVTKDELVRYLKSNTNFIKEDTITAPDKMLNFPEDEKIVKELQQKYTELQVLDNVAFKKQEWNSEWPTYSPLDAEPDHILSIKPIKYLQDNFVVENDEIVKWGDIEDLVLSAKGQNPYRYFEDDFVDEKKFINSSKRLLNQLAKSKNMSVDNFVNKYPKGYFSRDPSEKGQYVITKNRKEAEDIDWKIIEPKEIKYVSEYFENDVAPMLYSELKEFGELPRFATPDELTYTSENFPLGGTNTSETVYRYEDPTGKLQNYIEDAHLFDGLSTKDIIAHTRTAEFPVVDGGNAYHVGELQSDIAQIGRDRDIRSRAEEIDWQEYGGSIESSQYSGAPFVESTNQWVDMLLKKELKKAINSGSEFMTIPSSKLVRKYTHGSAEGQGQFYDSIVPMRLQKLAKKYDPNAKIVQKKIKTEVSDENVKALPLTQILINNVLKTGLPKYAMPITAIGGYGALSELKEEPQ